MMQKQKEIIPIVKDPYSKVETNYLNSVYISSKVRDWFFLG